MARKRVLGPVAYKSWEEADEALRAIGEAEREIEKIEHAMQDKIDEAKEEAKSAALSYQELIKESERRLSAFAEEHREELGNKKSREMNYGTIGYRKSTRLIIPRAHNKLAIIIKKIKAHGMDDCIITPPEKIDKEALKKYPPNEIIAVGAGLDVNDNFWYEVDKEKIN